MQEAYHPPCSEYSFCCPNWVPPPARYPPPQLDLAGYPPRCLPHGILGNVAKHYGIWVPPRCLPHGILGNVAKRYGYPPGVDKLTKWNYYLPVVLRTRAVNIFPFTCFSGTGYITDTGLSRGKYYTVNVPLKDGVQDEEYIDIFTR